MKQQSLKLENPNVLELSGPQFLDLCERLVGSTRRIGNVRLIRPGKYAVTLYNRNVSEREGKFSIATSKGVRLSADKVTGTEKLTTKILGNLR